MSKRFKISAIALKISATYALFGFLWILLSDRLLLFLARNQNTVNMLQTYKGWFYVLVTALLVCLLINKYIRNLQQSEQRYRRLLASIADPIYLIDVHGRIVNCNNAAVQRLGYSREELLNLTVASIDPNENLKDWGQKIGGAGPDDKFLLESVNRCKDGTEFPVEISARVYDEVKDRYVLGVVRDISERKHTFELLAQNEKMNSLGNLAAGIAHEINNPLSAILGASQNINNRIFRDTPKNLQAAKDCNADLEQIRAYLEKRDIHRMIASITSAGERASKIVSNMLNFSYSSHRDLENCNISSLLDETLELISADFNLAKEYDFKKIEIIKNYKEKNFPVCCIRSAVEQVFLNLFKNATQAMADKNYESGEKPQLNVRVKSSDGYIYIEVEDNGTGMSDETRKRIFEPFYTSKAVGKGTGLGLSVSYFIITDQHNGEMKVESSLGKGTKFTIIMPEEFCR